MRGGTIVGRIVLAVAGLIVALAIATYFINPFHSPLQNPIARVLGFATYRMPSRSMEPTLKDGALFIVNTATLRNRDPALGEIVVFLYPPNPHVSYVKRVVAVGGTTVEMRAGVVFVDGKRLPEPYLASVSPFNGDLSATEIPANFFFVLGDNRDNSEDSRAWGLVPRENMIGVFNGLAINN